MSSSLRSSVVSVVVLLSLVSVVESWWTQWGPWGLCNADCGGGDQFRERICTRPLSCGTTPDTQSRNCNNFPCPIHGGWENWESWTSCTKTCGGGTTSRERSCDSPSPDYGGNFCQGGVAQNIDNEGVEWQWTVCNNFLCEGSSGPLPPVVLPTIPPSMTTASTGAAASVRCTRRRRRRRKC